MVQNDIPSCLVIIREGWDKFIAQTATPDLSDMFSSAAWRPHFYVAVDDNDVVGLVGYNVAWLAHGVYSLTWLGVTKEKRGEGIGTMLVERCLADLRPIGNALILVTDVPDYYRANWNFVSVTTLRTSENEEQTMMMLEFEDE